MSSESNDSEQISDWTLVSAGDDDEIQVGDVAENEEDKPQGDIHDNSNKNDVATSETSDDAKKTESFQLESKVEDISPEQQAKPQTLNLPELSKEGSDSSDIERLSEDGVDNYPMDASVVSQTSSFSLLSGKEAVEVDNESVTSSSSISVIRDDDSVDYSNYTSSKDELPLVLDNERVRSYTHKPNRKLNLALSLVLTLSVTMVVGLGIGHFIGWSSRWTHDYQLQQTHIVKLKTLQEELVNCLQNPETNYMQENGEVKECYEKVDYWKKRFEDILSENQGLQELIDRSAQDDDDDDEKCEEANKNIIGEYRTLKFHLIRQQLENVATLRRMEALKRQEMATLDRVKQLEEENEELKAQVEDDNESSNDDDDDADKEMIQQLTDENQELRKELADLMTALELEKEEDENKITEEIGSLRQQINQLKTENSELQQVIAKLRYGQPPKEPLKDSADDDSVIRTWITDHFEGLNLTGFMEYLTQVAMDKKMARRELQQLQENLKSSYEQLSEKAKLGISTGKSILSEIQTNLQSKLEQMMNVADTSSKSALPMETIRKMGNIVKNTVEKMYKIGGDMLSSESTTPSSESNQANKLKKQMDKVFKSFTKQWDNIKSKMWGGGGTSTTPERASAMDEKNAKQEAKAESNWKKDAKRRDTGVEPKIKMTQTRMDHQDHKNKATVPENDVHHDRDNSPKSSKHVDKKKRKFQNDVNEYSKTSSQSNANLDTEKRDKNNNINNNKNNNHFKNSAFKSKGNANNELKMKTKQKITNQNGSNYSETSGDWLFKRSMDRSIKRKSKQQSDWLFDRAKDRQSQRKEATRSEWYFERSNHPKKHHDDDDDDADDWDDDDDYVNHKYADKKRYWNKIKYYRDFNDDYYHDDDDDDDDDNGESHKRWKKSNKKNKHRKNRKVHSDSDDEDSSDFEETTTEKNYKSKREYHKYWFNWAIPHPKSYVSS